MKLARPLLFQNSLHNSSAGMVSLHYGLTGPVITTSHPLTLSQDSLNLAELMLSSNLCSFVFVVNVETESGILGYDGPPEGAQVLLLAKPERAHEYGIQCLKKRPMALSPIGFTLTDL